MLFLPGSLISSIFGMGFFSTSPATDEEESGAGAGARGIFAVSNKWWLYFAVAVPLTLIVMIVMIFYQRRQEDGSAKQSSKVSSLSDDSEAQLSEKKQT